MVDSSSEISGQGEGLLQAEFIKKSLKKKTKFCRNDI
jgi:hypothetical protein